ncbi:MAG: hypothetical protein AB1430_06555 [Pseudomonadota bacterium]
MHTIPSDLGDESFMLPIAGLFGDLDTGAGTVQLPDAFFAASPQVQLNLAADWQRALAQLRLRAFEQLYRELAYRHRFDGPEEVARRFSDACRQLGQEWPPELAQRLQAARASATGG